MPEVINFYYIGEDFGEFSNFASYPIELGGRTWPTSEHYFQAQKFVGTEHEEAIRSEPSPMKAAKMGRDRHRPMRLDWDAVKDDIMRKADRAKFNQHQQLRQMLLDTGDAMIETIEEVMHNFIDTKTGYWLGRTYKELQKTERALNEKIDGLLKMYGTEDEVKKTFSVDPKTMPANYARYEKAFMDLMKEETEVSVYKMNVNDVIRRNPDFRFRGSWFLFWKMFSLENWMTTYFREASKPLQVKRRFVTFVTVIVHNGYKA